MKKINKGEFGYLVYKRRQLVLIVALILAAVLAIYLGAYFYFHTNANWFSIFAILLCLPLAHFVVNLVMFCRATPCSEAAQEEIGKAAPALPAGTEAFDLYMTGYQKSFALSHLTIHGNEVIALTEDPKCDCRAGEQHIRHMMQQNNFHGYTVKIFSSRKQYCNALSGMALRQGAGAGDAPEGASSGRQAQLMKLFYNISL